MHPRCRSTISAVTEGGTRTAKVGGKSIRVPAEMSYEKWRESLKSGKLQILERETAAVSNNGLKNAYTVNFELMNSKAYHDKFEGLSANKNVDESLYKQATKILSHRNGTEYEDIAILDARTGILLVENTSATVKFKCGLTYAQYQKLRESGKEIEILHNHPNSTEPSTADIIGLFKREMARASTIIAHDGTVYRLEKLKQFAEIENLIQDTYEEVRKDFAGLPEGLIECRTVRRLISILEKQKILRYKEVK